MNGDNADQHPQCALFKELKRTDIRVDLEAYRALEERLSPIIGNLRQVHEAMKKNMAVEPITPVLQLVVDSWQVGNERAYCIAAGKDVMIV